MNESSAAAGDNPRVEFDMGTGLRITTIVHWSHPGGPAHCLIRFFERGPNGRPLAIASEIRSNPYLRGITYDFAKVACAFLEQHRDRTAVPPDSIVWLAHHGEFSTYDAFGQPTTFTRIDLRWDGAHYHDGVDRHHELGAREADELLRGLDLEQVPHALAEIGWKF